jgi:formylglycine-generating enzyme required for sulfatase activity
LPTAILRSGDRQRPLLALVLAAAALALGSGAAFADEDRLCDGYGGLPEGAGPTVGMVPVRGGAFTMGDDDERSEERLAHRVAVSDFWIDRHEVTNAQFARFVAATGYRTVAERGLTAVEHPELPPELLAPGATVFASPQGMLQLVDVRGWWQFVAGADWRHPEGPGSSIEGKANRPVVDVAYEDALAYARWLGRDLPTEAQWEYAARGGLDGSTYGLHSP